MKTIKVVAAVIVKDGKMFVARRGYGDLKGRYEIPGGKVEPGEAPKDALRREIREELDTEISVKKYIGTIEYDYPAFHLSMRCYVCGVKSGKLALKEHLDAKWVAADELPKIEWCPADATFVAKFKEVLSEVGE